MFNLEGTRPSVLWGFSSAGRAPALQAGGHRFESGNLHQDPGKASDQIEAQRSGFDLERRHSEMSELSPEAEAKDMELVSTRANSSAG